MFRHKKVHAAFTLVELLTVIAILVLLVSMLVPVLGRAKELARLVVCTNNMYLLGQAGNGYAAQHEGRGPGYAHRAIPSGSSISWVNILNSEYFKADRIQRMGPTPGKGKIYCPIMKYWGSDYPRGHKWNYDADGGSGSVYGKILDVSAINPNWDFYSLGAVLANFPSPSTQFLASEGERGNDNCPGGNASPPYTVTLGGGGSYPNWCNSNGQWAFRHLLPPGLRLGAQIAAYQREARGTFAFIDGHAEVFGPSDNINARSRFAYRP